MTESASLIEPTSSRLFVMLERPGTYNVFDFRRLMRRSLGFGELGSVGVSSPDSASSMVGRANF